jgi:hypothetical protein
MPANRKPFWHGKLPQLAVQKPSPRVGGPVRTLDPLRPPITVHCGAIENGQLRLLITTACYERLGECHLTSDIPQATDPRGNVNPLAADAGSMSGACAAWGYSAAPTLLPTRFPVFREVISVFFCICRGLRRLDGGWMRHAGIGFASLPSQRVTQAKLLESPPVQQPSARRDVLPATVASSIS